MNTSFLGCDTMAFVSLIGWNVEYVLKRRLWFVKVIGVLWKGWDGKERVIYLCIVNEGMWKYGLYFISRGICL